jgi:hypothetical protein
MAGVVACTPAIVKASWLRGDSCPEWRADWREVDSVQYHPEAVKDQSATLFASTASAMMSAIGVPWLLREAIVQGLAPHLQHVAAARRPCIRTAPAMGGQRHLAWHRHVTGRSTILRKSYAAVYRLGHLPRGRSIWSAADLQVLPPVCMISYTVPHIDGGAQSLTAAFRPSEPDDSGLRASSLTPIRYTHITLIRRGRKRLKLALVTIVTANLEQLCIFYQPWQLCRISPGSRYPGLVAPVRMFGLRDHAHAKRG